MKGLDLSKLYYETYGKKMLTSEFHDVMDRIAVGLVGHGSECFGFDDEISQDHDFEPGFCLWLTEEDEKAFGFRLFRAYRRLPKEFMGVTLKAESVLGSKKRGVQTIPAFYSYYTGSGGAPSSLEAWVRIPSFYLAEATNGEVFYDPLGEFTKIRKTILHGMPKDALKKRLASSLLVMAQSGQYNVKRCLLHCEYEAAAMARSLFVKEALEVVYLLNGRYCPYYKWAFRGLESLSLLNQEGSVLKAIILAPVTEELPLAIEEVSHGIITELIRQGYSQDLGDYLEPYAHRIHQTIRDSELRAMPVILS